MKSKIIFLAILLLGLTVTFSSCKKDDPEPTPTTGGLIVKVKLSGSTGFLIGADRTCYITAKS